MPRSKRPSGFTTGAALLVLLLAAAPSSFAQSRVHVLFNDRSACTPWNALTCTVARLVTATVDGTGGRVDAARVVPFVANVQRLYVTPDGTTAVWLGYADATGYALYVHDFARQETRMLVLGVSTPGEFVGNPARPEVYLVGSTGVMAYAGTGGRSVADRACPNPREVSVSLDGRRLAVSCGPVNRPAETAVLDLRTGHVLGIIPLSYGQLNSDGSEYVGRSPSNELQRWDVATGSVVATGPNNFGRVLLDASGLVVTHGGTFVTQHEPASLAMVWSGHIPNDVPPPLLDGRHGLMYSFGGSAFTVFDIGARRVRLQAGPVAGSRVMFALAPVPGAPRLDPATVNGHGVGLTWAPSNVHAVTRYVLEVGSAPGLSDIFTGLDVGLQTSFAASGVPPGRYYVRVRAGNYTGLSAPSNEVVVQVP